MKKTVLTALGCLMLHPLYSQNYVDALRYSGTRFGSTARNLSMGGAFGAVGADASVMGINPAGLGQYRASEFSFGIGAHGSRLNSDYIGTGSQGSVFNLSLPNLSYVGTVVLNEGEKKKGWQSYSIGVGLNRVNNFWKEMNYEAVNRQSSITHYFAERAAGVNAADLDLNSIEGLAYNTYLINPDGNGNYSSIINDSVNLLQSGRYRSEGNMNEYNIALGANYNDVFYGGIGVVISTVRFASAESFAESNQKNNEQFKDMEFLTRISTGATGIGARLGFIVRASDMFRFGAALQTPSIMGFSDEYDYAMKARYDSSSYNYESDILTFDYKLTTPLKLTGSAAVIFGKKGLLSADLEYIDYSRSNLSSVDYTFKQENREIEDYYRSVVNLRLGAEYVYEVFRFRAGLAMYGSPFSDKFTLSSNKAAQKSVSVGAGIRGATYFLDLAYMYSVQEDYYTPYNKPQNREAYPVISKWKTNNVVLTLGFRFE